MTTRPDPQFTVQGGVWTCRLGHVIVHTGQLADHIHPDTPTPRPPTVYPVAIVRIHECRNELANIDRHLTHLTRPGRSRDWDLIDMWLDKRSVARRALNAALKERP